MKPLQRRISMYYVYIGYRDLPRYFNDQNQMGGTP